RLRAYFNLLALDGLALEDPFESIRQAGYEGVQFIEPMTAAHHVACDRLGLGRTSCGRVNQPAEADSLARRFAAEGQECATLHVGWGIEDDDECFRLIEAILTASARHRVPLYVETHRATIFQDIWRSVQFVKRFPELRFNGDFSHWYTGLEMVYGGIETKLDFARPVIERVHFMHGRIGNPGSIQVDIGDGAVATHPYVNHFRLLWTAVFEAFHRAAQPGDYFLFVPELLSHRIYYARTFQGKEECDRWQQSLVLRHIAEECFLEARRTLTVPARCQRNPETEPRP
ncbi:MAG: hypothetical protein NTY38_22780, partial [Acidobacteria bacterium]|nr:hypothetical protein [Acidobacteriota bacterium]